MIKLTYNNKSRNKTPETQASPSAQPETETRVETVLSASPVSLTAGASAASCESGPPAHQVIKLGIDVPLDRYVVVRQIDGGAPQPPQRFSPRQFLEYSQPPDGSAGMSGYTVESPSVIINVTNAIRYPRWQDQAELAVKVDAEADMSSPEYTLWFFNSGYPKAMDPSSSAIQTAYYQGVAMNGIISYSAAPGTLGFGDGDSDPDIYSSTEYTPEGSNSPQANANRNTRHIRPFPPVGKWVVSYEMDGGDYWWYRTNSQYQALLDPKDIFGQYYYHGDQLGTWCGCALISADNNGPLIQGPGGSRQTWPVRDKNGGAVWKDARLLLGFLANTDVSNFYGSGHGRGTVDSIGPVSLGTGFMGIKTSELQRKLKNRRYRFVFLDGCSTHYGGLLYAFGADSVEIGEGFSGDPGPLDLSAYTDNLRPAAFLSWSVDVPSAVDLPELTIDDFGRPCIKQAIGGICFFEGQLASNWAYGDGTGPMKLGDAIFLAKFWTTELFTPQELKNLNLDDLKQNGYRDLRCTEYNHAGDWP